MAKEQKETNIHGSFLTIKGKGVVITGVSGIGKSETTLELMDRGHKFIVDDGLLVTKKGNDLIGRCPEAIKNLIEIRGLGIINVKKLYNRFDIISSHKIDYICHLKEFSKNTKFERIGRNKKHQEILGVAIPLIEIPVSAARNTALLIEIAIRNQLLKDNGFNAIEWLGEQIGDDDDK